MVDHINNGEEGYAVREKLNTVIDRTNTLNGIENQVETNRQNIANNTNSINNLWDHVDDIEDQIQDLDVAVLDAKVNKEIQDRIDGDQALQDQINAIDPDGDSSIDWSDIENKPSQFPPSAHGHEIADVNGLQDALDAVTPTEIPPWDYEFTPNTLVLRNDKGDIKGKKVIGQNLQMTTGGTTPTARPDDTIFYSSVSNQIYKNTAEGMRESLDVYSKSEVDELAPSNTLEGAWDYSQTTAASGSFTTRNENWLTATTITLHKFDSTGFEHNFALMNDGDIIYMQTQVGGAEYEIVSKTVNGDACDFLVNTISYYGPFPLNGESTKVNFIPQVSAGSSVTIGSSPPDPVTEGMQWLETPPGEQATMWIYDGEKWLQSPAGKDGKDGAPGADGNIQDATEDGVIATWDNTTGQWTPDGSVVVDADGNVGVGVSPGTTEGLNIYVDSNISWRESSGGSTCNIYRQASSGALVLSQGYKQTVTPNGFSSSMAGNFPKAAIRIANGINFYVDDYTDVPVGTDITPTKRMSIDYNGRVDITGSLYVNGTPKIGTVDMIQAFSKLRDAIKDEETVESLKESITNCIGGLIEEWEAMQSPATQEVEDE